jgi:hypothetical protein
MKCSSCGSRTDGIWHGLLLSIGRTIKTRRWTCAWVSIRSLLNPILVCITNQGAAVESLQKVAVTTSDSMVKLHANANGQSKNMNTLGKEMDQTQDKMDKTNEKMDKHFNKINKQFNDMMSALGAINNQDAPVPSPPLLSTSTLLTTPSAAPSTAFSVASPIT